ncbi:sensor histidine kinase [Dinghuibacter silviterrae]|uniref:Histidine kinase n=1 Tax=Dinghuibacter silviterrae TaxID=1539049 RepID=A0A4R8DFG6_9BACT|nr:histidine kinase [Dinghuibacter silviterrae]TDW95984.1 histidine kinase [Dinghuibacter silviterrae]
MKAHWYRRKSIVVLMHAAVWLLFFLLPVLLRPPANRRFIARGPRPAEVDSFFRAGRPGPPPDGFAHGDSGRRADGGFGHGPADSAGTGRVGASGGFGDGGPGGPGDTPALRFDGRGVVLRNGAVRTDVFGWFNFFTDLWLVLVFYFNTQVLIPAFFKPRRYLYFAISHVLLFAGLLIFNRILFVLFIGPAMGGWPGPLQFTLFPYLLVAASGVIYRLVRGKLEEERGRQERENESLKTELALLRMQVSPHFMFNVLNNMVALARKRSQQLEPSLIKLSSLMRYMLYEADGKVPLDKEIEYLENYIDLQRQRFAGSMAVTVDAGPRDMGLDIEPMLLIPFVENAFKHGRDGLGDGSIRIAWKAVNGILAFSVQNTFGEQEDKTPGIGLTNVRRRLDLLYKDRYTLDIRKEGEWFFVFLQIKL